MPLTAPAIVRSSVVRCALLVSLGLPAAPLRADSEQALREAAVTEVVLGILSYVRWPHEPERLRLCVLGATAYADGLLYGELAQADGRSLDVQRREVADPSLGSRCDGVYLGGLDAQQRGEVFRALDGHAVLSISEDDAQCSVGSMFCLDVGATRVSFSVNLDSVARSGVRVHPSVLDLARRRGGA
ncbi:MAG: hypothetical protein GAK43_01472 [Stenotrophomonas maltophilia]|nr:MAG: hypothetical protein GAK43_01472 [Stenotrophomonas maltophilia]